VLPLTPVGRFSIRDIWAGHGVEKAEYEKSRTGAKPQLKTLRPTLIEADPNFKCVEIELNVV